MNKFGKICLGFVAFSLILSGTVNAQPAKWDTSKLRAKPKAEPKAEPKTDALPDFIAPPSAAPAEAAPVQDQIIVQDESEELLYIDRAFADAIYDKGALIAYSDNISPEGVLFDASGGTEPGKVSAETRFKGFPADIKLERKPERAMASHGAGATWGTYAVKRDINVLAEGRYTAIWRKENGVWKIVNELAAGKSAAPTLPQKAKTPIANPTNNPLLSDPSVLRDALGRPVAPKPKPANN